ncbi:MAG: hypothetical protein H5U32_02420 [Pseudomonas balearica]|uniref:hypothetical protein n=1 Tax=Stutzerimonas balearica TaxID=74829 RepID=UPI0019A3B4BA|nr:hypothetical protein [Stutzerimonas balearica]MBC7198082.1 hypothetical protein [Stutzerimonas balearica]
MQNIRTLARRAYKNRYAFDRVTVTKTGELKGWFKGLTPTKLGHIDDCRTVLNERRTGVRFYNRDFLVYTFGPEVAC